jgi:hypothetical protein
MDSVDCGLYTSGCVEFQTWAFVNVTMNCRDYESKDFRSCVTDRQTDRQTDR